MPTSHSAPILPSTEALAALRTELESTAAERDRTGEISVATVARLRKSGILGQVIPAEYGGAGDGYTALVDTIVQLATADPSVAQSLQPHFIFLERVRLMGSPAQRQRWLGAAARGTIFGNAMAELGGRTGAWTTRLIRRGGTLRVDGTKFYSTGSTIADVIFIGALDENGDRTLIALPRDRAGLEVSRDWQAFGQRATASGTVTLTDVAVADDEVISLAPWRERRQHTGAGSQIIHVAIDVGIAAAALRDAIEHTRLRARAPRESQAASAAQEPAVQHTVGAISADVFGAEAALARAAAKLDVATCALYRHEREHGGPRPLPDALLDQLTGASIAVAQAKVIATRAALRASERLFEVGGASGARSDLGLDRHWRNARTHTLHDPLAQKCRVIGDHLLNGTLPPNTFSF